MADCVSVFIDFNISSNLFYLKIEDFSSWSIIKEKPAVIEITIPGYSNPIKKYFGKEDTVYDAISLGIVCEDDDFCDQTELPDGIYKVKIIGSPSTFQMEHIYFKADQIRKILDTAIVDSLTASCTDCNRKLLLDANFLLSAGESATRMNLESEANEYYLRAKRILDKLTCKNCK